jgi:O-antigen ligase
VGKPPWDGLSWPPVTVAATSTARRERARISDRLPAVALGLLVAPVLGANGGFSPTSWGWTAAALAGACLVAASLRDVSRPTPLELLYFGGLLGFALWEALATAWTEAPSQTPLEVERTLVYVAAALAVQTLVARRRVGDLLGGLLGGLVLVCAYALATRLFPADFSQHLYGRGRLYTPVGYWNGLGIVAAMTALLSLATAARASKVRARALGAACLPVAVCTLYFTFSRGGWLALGLGLVVLIAFDRRRLNLLAAVAGPAVLTAIALGVAVREVGGVAVAETGNGRFVALVVVCASAASAYAMVLMRKLERSVKVPRRTQRIVTWALVALAIVALAGVFARFGSPVTIGRHAYRSLAGTPPTSGGDLNKRLFSLSSNGRLPLWRVAAHEFAAHPAGGGGPGSFEQEWLQHRTISAKVQDAHNLYLETLAETGVVGMLLLAAAFAAPLLAFARARREPLAVGALALYVAYLAHAAVDWDWELSGVTLVAILAGGALLVAARPEQRSVASRVPTLVTATVLLVAALFGLSGNLALSAAVRDADHGDFTRSASEARRAQVLVPWSAAPWQLLGNAQLALGEPAAARASLRTAASKSGSDWTIWLDLARASKGAERAHAIATAQRLNPHDRTIAAFARGLRHSSG